MPRVFLTSDTHFGHKNVIKHCKRPFSSVEEMDAVLIANWNSVVGPSDVVWHLGDFAWRDHLNYKAQLNGKINWILGNHDKCSTAVKAQFTSVRDLYHNRWQLSRYGLEPIYVFLLHYPLVSWFGKGRGAYHFYGHVHGRYSHPSERSLDVGVDCHNFLPIELNHAIELANIKSDGNLLQDDAGHTGKEVP